VSDKVPRMRAFLNKGPGKVEAVQGPHFRNALTTCEPSIGSSPALWKHIGMLGNKPDLK
jgi:hypothetical protein